MLQIIEEALELAKREAFDLIITGRKTRGPEDVEFLRQDSRLAAARADDYPGGRMDARGRVDGDARRCVQLFLRAV